MSSQQAGLRTYMMLDHFQDLEQRVSEHDYILMNMKV